MRRTFRELEHMLDEETAKAGATARVEMRSKHLMAVLTRGAAHRKVFMAATPSDKRAMLNNRAVVRRLLGEMVEAA